MLRSGKLLPLCKALCTLLALAAIISLLSVSTFAADIPDGYYQLSANSGSRTFTTDWEAVRSDKYGSYLTYGFNTFLVDEDYAFAEQSQVLHWAEIDNGTGWHYGPFEGAGSISSVEAAHSGSGIYYACAFG